MLGVWQLNRLACTVIEEAVEAPTIVSWRAIGGNGEQTQFELVAHVSGFECRNLVVGNQVNAVGEAGARPATVDRCASGAINESGTHFLDKGISTLTDLRRWRRTLCRQGNQEQTAGQEDKNFIEGVA